MVDPESEPKRNWLRHVNPFHFEESHLRMLVVADVLMAALLLLFAWVVAGQDSHSMEYMADRPVITESKLSASWNVVAMRKVIATEDAYQHQLYHNLEHIYSCVAAVEVGAAAWLLGNAFYFVKVRQLVASLKAKKS